MQFQKKNHSHILYIHIFSFIFFHCLKIFKKIKGLNIKKTKKVEYFEEKTLYTLKLETSKKYIYEISLEKFNIGS